MCQHNSENTNPRRGRPPTRLPSDPQRPRAPRGQPNPTTRLRYLEKLLNYDTQKAQIDTVYKSLYENEIEITKNKIQDLKNQMQQTTTPIPSDTTSTQGNNPPDDATSQETKPDDKDIKKDVEDKVIPEGTPETTPIDIKQNVEDKEIPKGISEPPTTDQALPQEVKTGAAEAENPQNEDQRSSIIQQSQQNVPEEQIKQSQDVPIEQIQQTENMPEAQGQPEPVKTPEDNAPGTNSQEESKPSETTPHEVPAAPTTQQPKTINIELKRVNGHVDKVTYQLQQDDDPYKRFMWRTNPLQYQFVYQNVYIKWLKNPEPIIPENKKPENCLTTSEEFKTRVPINPFRPLYILQFIIFFNTYIESWPFCEWARSFILEIIYQLCLKYTPLVLYEYLVFDPTTIRSVYRNFLIKIYLKIINKEFYLFDTPDFCCAELLKILGYDEDYLVPKWYISPTTPDSIKEAINCVDVLKNDLEKMDSFINFLISKEQNAERLSKLLDEEEELKQLEELAELEEELEQKEKPDTETIKKDIETIGQADAAGTDTQTAAQPSQTMPTSVPEAQPSQLKPSTSDKESTDATGTGPINQPTPESPPPKTVPAAQAETPKIIPQAETSQSTQTKTSNYTPLAKISPFF